ncbi:N-acetylneuraminate synthase family protein [Leptospira weilii]|uniref:N-acetylneuraminate synthase family protein n=1 Tax=Leptospira weilii TaxID=28184 RepID=UPI00256ED641|nr:N-acetylneuraminate synthase family protein [Leptospira weilii]MDL5246322.1 N-acetylneuraminate synthase family protein [Leptospira weilii]
MSLEFIAEIGMNHNGNFGLAYELIRQAKYSGADIAKFQLGWRSKKEEINFIDEKILLDLKKWSEYFEMELMFSVFTPEAYNLIKPFDFPRYKIASRTVKDNIDLVKEIVEEGKPTYISLGMWEGKDLPITGYKNIQYLWCKSSYPSTPWDLLEFPKNFNDSPYFGYSDHSIGIDTALLAISRGAKIIEKHFTLDKSDVTIRDHALSAIPSEFLMLTQIGKEMYKKISLGI